MIPIDVFLTKHCSSKQQSVTMCLFVCLFVCFVFCLFVWVASVGRCLCIFHNETKTIIAMAFSVFRPGASLFGR